MSKPNPPAMTEREKALQKKVEELSTLYEVNKILSSTMDLDSALRLVVKTTAEMMMVKACGLRLLDKSTGEMVLKAVYGLSQEYINKGRVFVWKGLYKDVILGGQVAVVLLHRRRDEHEEEMDGLAVDGAVLDALLG